MHKVPIPRIGGLAIFFAFAVTLLSFCEISPETTTLLVGGLLIVTLGTLDDIFRLNYFIKFLVQLAVALFAFSQGISITFINFFGTYIGFNSLWSGVVTVFWIIGITNAVNLIDGLDGLACGVSSICAASLLCVTLIAGDYNSAMLTAVLLGGCLGFFPFNANPAKIFMGDSGALFLGYILSIISINGVFKTHAALSFLIPLSIFGLPLFETIFSFFRRIFNGKNPFAADGLHIHHRLIAFGMNQKQAVRMLYAICGILGISAVMLTEDKKLPALIIFTSGVAVFVIMYYIIQNKNAIELAGLKGVDNEK
jgi:UDP-GlcNAc:undecaprenyl-phosphate GlcNAc-1-phosphate transferase